MKIYFRNKYVRRRARNLLMVYDIHLSNKNMSEDVNCIAHSSGFRAEGLNIFFF